MNVRKETQVSNDNMVQLVFFGEEVPWDEVPDKVNPPSLSTPKTDVHNDVDVECVEIIEPTQQLATLLDALDEHLKNEQNPSYAASKIRVDASSGTVSFNRLTLL